MGLFDLFKKKDETPDYDPTNIKITDLRKGFIFEYDLSSWAVESMAEYDWGNNNFSQEYKVTNGEEIHYLHVDNDGELTLTLSQPIKIRKLDSDIIETIVEEKSPPKKIYFNDVKYFLDRESAGYYKDADKEHDDWDEFISWDYFNEEGDLTLGIMQWGEKEFEASEGKILKVHEISGIIPA